MPKRIVKVKKENQNRMEKLMVSFIWFYFELLNDALIYAIFVCLNRPHKILDDVDTWWRRYLMTKLQGDETSFNPIGNFNQL